jgi:hypothetical protein
MLIKDILTIDLSEDIKSVIDLEDISEAAIKSEIENYIVTDGLAKEYSDFVSTFTDNIVETGVWISGFYGSGKSYFGKLLGYMLSNRDIMGTPARDLILQRFTGIADEALIKSSISKLNRTNSRVVFMDITKQDKNKGFAYALFSNFLKSLELPGNEHGFLLFSLMCDSGLANVTDFVKDKLGKQWSDFKNSRTIYSGKIKDIYIKDGHTEADYIEILTTIRREIDQFSAAKLKDELTKYLKNINDEKIVFLFDETSEAINQKMINILDLESVSEALSALGGKVWTIAIAQEKLDDVITSSNHTKAQLTKVTDRFKTKIPLEATEVDVIIRSRLLKKNDAAITKLNDHYKVHSGKIGVHSGLVGAEKTENVDSYITYYPFYKNQFALLQNFLFGRLGAVSTKIAARGMIITTYDILKREIQKEELFNIATGWQIAKEAQPSPPPRLVNRYDNAQRILKQENIDLSGRNLLETIFFLTEAEVAPTSLSNIVNSFIKLPEEFPKIQPLINKALDVLIEHKILLLSNGTYRITSDIEQRLLDEMNQFTVPVNKKKVKVIFEYKAAPFIKALANISDNSTLYDFYITSDNDDELTNPKLKQLKIKVKSIYNYGEDRTANIDQIKMQYQNDKDVIWLAPSNSSYKEIDKLLDEMGRIEFLEEKYPNPNSDEGPIVRGFQAEKSTKEIRLKELIELSLIEGNSIYLYNVGQLDKNNWQTIISGLQREVVQNVYSQRLATQLMDAIAEKIIKEANDQRLHTYFTSQGADFQFFDNHGVFIGQSLKSAEQILLKVKNTFVDVESIEKDLIIPPTGYSWGTIKTTLAALMRGGKIIAKSNGTEKYSWKDEGVAALFVNNTTFKKVSFKAISKALESAKKTEIVKILQELEYETHVGKKIDWNINDFDLANAVRELAKRFCDKVDDMRKSNKDFDLLFSNIEGCKDQLGEFTGAVSEANYVDRAENFLTNKEVYKNAIKEVEKAETFIRNKLLNLRQWHTFADAVIDELNKSAKQDLAISDLVKSFNDLYKGEVVKNFVQLEQTAQKIKDAYFKLMQTAASEMSVKYIQLEKDAKNLIEEIKTLPAGLNDEATLKTNTILQFASQRTSAIVDVDYDIKDKKTKFTYSEMHSFIELYIGKSTELEIIKSSLRQTAPPKQDDEVPPKPDDETPPKPDDETPPPPPAKKTLTTTLPSNKVTIIEYKAWLHQELRKVAGASDSDEIEFNK